MDPNSRMLMMGASSGGSLAPFSASVLVLAGGGGGASEYFLGSGWPSVWSPRRGGAGGAGGLLIADPVTIEGGVTYTVTVGDGGGRGANYGNSGRPGEDSSFVGDVLNLVAVKGDYGTHADGAFGPQSRVGGSGGGGGSWGPGYPLPAGGGGQGTSGQGNPGGFGIKGSSSGGGGGKGSAASNASPGGGYNLSSFGLPSEAVAVGGAGATSDNPGADATARGSGGGGSGSSITLGNYYGGNGSAGLVILRYSSALPLATSVSGTYTRTTSASYHFYRFEGDGSITF